MFTTHHTASENGSVKKVLEVPAGEFETNPDVSAILWSAIAGKVERLANGNNRITYLTRK